MMRSQDGDSGSGFRRKTIWVNGANGGFLNQNADIVVTKTGTGTYVVRYPKFKVVTQFHATQVQSPVGFVQVGNADPKTVNITTYNSAGTPTDGNFALTVEGIPA